MGTVMQTDGQSKPDAHREVVVRPMTDDDFERALERASERGAQKAIAALQPKCSDRVTAKEAEEILGCSTRTLGRYVAAGQLKRVGKGKRKLFVRAELEALLKAGA